VTPAIETIRVEITYTDKLGEQFQTSYDRRYPQLPLIDIAEQVKNTIIRTMRDRL
jgi:hypothetical protein